MEKVLTDCFWCGEAYELGVHGRCPKCSTDVNTKAVEIIKPEAAAAAADGTSE
jgi:hypothetical protein